MDPRVLDVCRGCGKPKTPETFGSYMETRGPGAGTRKLRARCHECIAAYRRERYARNPERYRAEGAADYKRRKQANPQLNRERELRRNYGLTMADFITISEAQLNVCAVCQRPASKWLHVDHCHREGIIRGLLCESCNWALGAVDDSIEQLRQLIAYLENPPMRIDLPENSRARKLWMRGGQDG